MDNTPATKKGKIASNGLFHMFDPAPLLIPVPSAPLTSIGGVDKDDGDEDVGIRDGRMLLLMMLGALDSGELVGT